MMTSHALCIMVVALPNFKPRETEHEPFIIGLSTLDPFSTKERTKLYKILKFGVNCANIQSGQ